MLAVHRSKTNQLLTDFIILSVSGESLNHACFSKIVCHFVCSSLLDPVRLRIWVEIWHYAPSSSAFVISTDRDGAGSEYRNRDQRSRGHQLHRRNGIL
jgi:hypothetical protein